ncbi:exonuclease SbcCD subunit D [Garciella nitratireducens]|uniref:Nuclease SbcCD subunit D n=1 Tax=Garciella nitratireducens DSM 15102 TaxID=1121911 RepID=A0A1T4MB49_9FIRM|nr:exonuclease SbcCD subunit D [Garciella nitratireducens]RBP37426.1 exodeoxyribonuclease I subunit D [Garciella nitratireducens]SJZ64076.1 Exodeoxyribonuclease I subunit D [Garciella nitratireducens DSM 15102]
MRILHTSDWHLGKSLEGFSRLSEQEQFIEELIEIVEREKIDMILVAGDVYDTYNPPAAAEQLFYKSMKELSKQGQRPIVIIPGNHDNAERLIAASPLIYEQGVLLIGTSQKGIPVGKYQGFEILESGKYYLTLSIKNEQAVVLALPYPTEKTLNEMLTRDADEEIMQKSYSERIGRLFQDLSKHYRKDTINLALSHLFMVGGEESGSERQIQLGGSLAVESKCLPKAQYIALGHLHRSQKVIGGEKKAYYSGSPIQYSKSEIHYSKCVHLVEVEPSKEAKVTPMYLRNYKPIEVWRCSCIEDALRRCEKESEKEAWIYLEIETDRVLTADEIKSLKDFRRDIVEIRPLLTTEDFLEKERQDIKDLNIMELFFDFYRNKRGVEPDQEMVELFAQIIGEGEKENEALVIESEWN